MAESVANASLETLRDLLVEETKFLVSVSGDVERVKADLRSIHALLMKADRERRDSPTLKLYISQLKDLAEKAENLLETYAVEVQSEVEGRKTLKEKFQRYICIILECCSVRKVGKEARSIISALAELTNKLESELGQESSSLSRQGDDERQRMLRQTYGHEVEHDFVGMEKDIELLVSKVKDETRNRRVVKIYGMGGLGKTTLARKVYNHTDLLSYTRAWVCITQQFQPKAVFGDILKQLDKNAQIGGMEELVRGIHNLLKERKCLVVIDDIWSNDDWEIIKQAFPVNCNVILTTRYENIANRQSEPYKLEFMTKDEGWALLQKIADLSPVDPDFKSFEDIGRVIVSKCEGLPLSICVIGGILHQKVHSLPEWRRVNQNMELNLRRGEGVENYTRVNQVLELSYDALPYYLKPCFLYLACLPEDKEINTEKLYLLWMAEGFISYQDKGPNETLRDVAQRYLKELVMRCMVQLHKARYYFPLNKFDTCGLHDLMHDLCSSKAEEEKFLKRINASKYLTDRLSPTQKRLVIPPSTGDSISRLAINFDFRSFTVSSIDGLEEIKGLRSFMLFPKLSSLPTRGFKESTIDFEMSQYLRIFLVEGCKFEGEKLPIKVGELIHLRYLSLRYSNVGELPKSICNMPYLQTLDLRVSHVIRLPNVICKMKRLKHLFLPSIGIEVIGGEKLRLDGLHELETLEWIDSETTCIADIPKLISLQSLRVRVFDEDCMSIVLSNKNRQLRETHLEVKSCDLSSEKNMEVLNEGLMSPSLITLMMSSCNMSGGFPYYKQGMCQNLAILELYNCKGKVDVEEFGKYPMLQVLALDHFVKMSETITFRSDSFPQLKLLEFQWLPDLKKLEVEKGAMPKLTSIVILECPNLEKVPDGLSSSLRLMGINEFIPREFIVRVEEEDYGPLVEKNIKGPF
ncbi:probable disease resistance protein At1g58390 [Salvia hispanica]|uniref:probable disease resistance protein At1g58390 n=1 Tax=Salvia hispanica TaxID=49212 RepID=UPI0020095A3C|nr:probable disease resistance protein At1g58390 [Salvia hispanica]